MSVQTRRGKILIIDDDQDILIAARMFLKQRFAVVHTENTPDSIPTALKNESYDVILLDMNFARGASSGKEGFDWLSRILEVDPSAVVILTTAYGDVQTAVKAIKQGATDFVLKPWQNEKLLATLSAALNLRESRMEASTLRSQQQLLSHELAQPFLAFLGQCAPMVEVFRSIEKVAKTEANVLILGENGTGKELVARELHRQSLRSDKVFISVDMGAITETLFESELFGYKKGAFTDAKEDRAGRFEVASGGTLFLDEIGNLSLPLQSKLLSALQNRKITRLGSSAAVDIDVRLICATNMPIYDMVEQKEFRQDLLYRINTIAIGIPPLRERGDDLPLLADHFLNLYAKKYNKSGMKISAATMKRLSKYHWPGNVRELQHAIERALIMSESPVLQPEDFFFSAQESKEDGLHFDRLNLEEVERTVIQRVLGKHAGNISKAAAELGLTRTSLYRRLEKYGL
jgi:DNA-binding NtrC family response regulator